MLIDTTRDPSGKIGEVFLNLSGGGEHAGVKNTVPFLASAA